MPSQISVMARVRKILEAIDGSSPDVQAQVAVDDWRVVVSVGVDLHLGWRVRTQTSVAITTSWRLTDFWTTNRELLLAEIDEDLLVLTK